MKSSVLLLIAFVIIKSECAKILSIFTVPSPSHYIFASALLKELASRGHEVTSVNTFPQKTPVKNFRDLFIETNTNIVEETMMLLQSNMEPSIWTNTLNMQPVFKQMCINVFEHPEFKELLKTPEGKFDLIIVEVIYSDSFYGLGQHFNAPMIGVSTFGTTIGIDDSVGNSSPNSVIPNLYLTYSPHMTFWERMHKFIANLQIYLPTNYRNYFTQKDVFHKYFPQSKLSFDEARTNFSLLLLNTHHSLHYPRSYATNVIEVGGLHIKRNPDPLPSDLQMFLDNATDGAIYFSMGSNLKGNNFPIEWRNIFLNIFSRLKQKVLWKFEDPELPNKPNNVLIKPWLPQHSVLNHRNVKVFMTHGGLLSTTEAFFYGKPLLGIPMFFDQPRNILLAEKKGMCRGLNSKTLTEQNVEEALLDLLNNPVYMEKAQDVSKQYHDQPLSAMDTAVFWIEYVLRHKGAAHLRSAAVDLNIFQYYSVDIIATLLAGVILVITLGVWLIKSLTKSYRNSKKLKRN